LAVVAAALAPAAARAGEPAERGASFTVSAGAAVAHGDAPAPMFGVTGVGNVERLALGGAVDGTPGTQGDGRLSVSGLVGYQPELGGTRLLLLAEGGRHRIGRDPWLPFVGLRVGLARTWPRRGPFEVGAWCFGRYDRLGGFLAGVAFHGGLRIESRHPWQEPQPEH
jgi:hypothetical protein